jgi:hypothetical protein
MPDEHAAHTEWQENFDHSVHGLFADQLLHEP